MPWSSGTIQVSFIIIIVFVIVIKIIKRQFFEKTNKGENEEIIEFRK